MRDCLHMLSACSGNRAETFRAPGLSNMKFDGFRVKRNGRKCS